MHSKRLIFKLFTLVAILSFNHQTIAQDKPFTKLINAKSLRCVVKDGSCASWENGKLKIERCNFSNSEEGSVFSIDNIKLTKNKSQGKARLIGNAAAVDVIVYPTGEGLTFIEESTSGNIMILTVFAYCNPGTSDYVCVYSRHVQLSLGNPKLGPIPSQYHGICKILD